MNDKVIIPSEMLEPVIQKTIAEVFEMFAIGSIDYTEMDNRLSSLMHFVDNCGAIHCSLAMTNHIGKIWSYKDNPEELRKKFKEIVDKHY